MTIVEKIFVVGNWRFTAEELEIDRKSETNFIRLSEAISDKIAK